MSSIQSLQPLSRLRAAAIALSLMAGVAAIPAVAQEAQTAAPAAPSYLASPNLQLFSSSSATSSQDDAVAGERFNLGSSLIGPNADANPQYGGGYGGPPRRRPYGRPTYRDRYTNADGSSKIAFEAGAGFSRPAGSTSNYQKTGWNFSVGAGRNFNRAFGVLVQYDFVDLGVSNSILDSLSNSAGVSIDGHSHVWSLTVDPVINFSDSHSRYGAYITGGGGFYRKLTSFSENSCDPYYEVYYGVCLQDSSTLAHWSNNAGGVNAGVGFTYKISAYSNLKLFAEARYAWVDNQPSSNNTVATGYPPANYRTGYFPVNFGIRF